MTKEADAGVLPEHLENGGDEGVLELLICYSIGRLNGTEPLFDSEPQ
jgi:hypothetical protein